MIKPLPKQQRKKQQFVVCDIETRSDGSIIAIGTAYTKQNKNEFIVHYNWREWLDYAFRKRWRRIYAHNGCHFDWLSLTKYIKDNTEYEIEAILAKSKVIVIRIRNGKHRLELCDSLHLLTASLAELCRSFKITHQKLDLEGKLPEDILATNPELFYKYLENDCLSLLEILQRFYDLINDRICTINKLPLTIASLALTIFRSTIDEPILVPWNKEVKEFSRRAYHGGLVNVYRPGFHPQVYTYDVNSMYPSVMLKYEYPANSVYFWSDHLLEGYLGLIEADFEQTNRELPPFLIDENTQEYSYKGHAVLTSAEVDKLQQIGGHVTVHRALYFRDKKHIFKDFVTKLYSLRREAQEQNDTALAYITKILMNSLYGKFAQRSNVHKIARLEGRKISEMLQKGTKLYEIDDICMIEENRTIEHEFTAIAAFVTAYARLELFDMICQYINNIIYVDTDSLHLTCQVNNKMLGTDLGKLKAERQGQGIYIAKKVYAICDGETTYIRCKGISQKTMFSPEKGLHFNLLYGLAKGEIAAIDIYFRSPPTIREILIKNHSPCRFYTRNRKIQPINEKNVTLTR